MADWLRMRRATDALQTGLPNCDATAAGGVIKNCKGNWIVGYRRSSGVAGDL